MDNPQEIKREKVRVVPIKFIDDFPIRYNIFRKLKKEQKKVDMLKKLW